MPKADLDRCWSYEGAAYGPGEADIPDGLHEILVEAGHVEKPQSTPAKQSESKKQTKKGAENG